jgi:predicted CoA-substrate-specific enzyme activase
MSVAEGKALWLGFDVGSVALKIVVTDPSGNVLDRLYRRTHGRPLETARTALEDILTRQSAERFELIAGTGSAGRLICELLTVPFVNEVICQATAIRRLYPDVRTLIEMGGQDSKFIILPDNAADGAMLDFAMNTNCAAGTGSFLDQQASRLGISIEEEFGRLALQSTAPPRVAGRCSVFAKSDMIHLQQQAAPMHDIVAGLCLGLARNLHGNLARGRKWSRPIAFCGGVAANLGVAHAIEEVFGLERGELIVPDIHAFTGALGALLVAHEGTACKQAVAHSSKTFTLNLTRLDNYLQHAESNVHYLEPLGAKRDSPVFVDAKIGTVPGKIVDAYLGLDVGSISTKAAVIDADNRVLAKIYLMTAGQPLEAVRLVLSAIHSQVGDRVRIRGAATTGSGRYLTGDFIGADLVINEITAQATAATLIDPEVDTIFEIGGQDSKYISLEGGVVVDFEMNHACAAGTGSFLEEQAERLGIKIREEFGRLALSSSQPIRLGERCTVFMESDLISHQQHRAATEDLVAGLCYSIVNNYINRVVGHRKIGGKIFFQGGTAFNQGVVAAFENVTGRKITVPPHHEVTGAIGAAALARRHQERHGRRETYKCWGDSSTVAPTYQSGFVGFELADQPYTVRRFTCDACSNACEINEVTITGRQSLCYGSRCDRYNRRKEGNGQPDMPDLFAERHSMLMHFAGLSESKKDSRVVACNHAVKPIPKHGEDVVASNHPTRECPTVGIPLALSNYQLLPFWGTLLSELGLNVVVSPVSTQQIINRGVEAVLSTPCFPVKVAHGHVLDLIDQGVDYLWLPSVLNMPREDNDSPHNELCPYVTAFPYQAEAVTQQRDAVVRILKPPIRFQDGQLGVQKCLLPMSKDLGVSRIQLSRAVNKAWQAQEDFEEACRARGREVLENLPPGHRAMVLVSRPYNGCDCGAYLNLPRKLRKLGAMTIPMDFLDLRSSKADADPLIKSMYWTYGRRILRAAEIVRGDPRLHAVYLSNFSCGPDSFITNYFKRLMAPKPSLILEVDEHFADAGAVTRLEAFLESLNSAPATPLPPRVPVHRPASPNGHLRTIYFPWMGDIAYGLAAAIRAYGQPAEVMPLADQRSIELGRRYCNGKECLPCIITAGDMIRFTQRADFDPDRAAFFMPGATGPCRFGQYNCMHKLILNKLGLDQVPIVNPDNNKEFYDHWQQFPGKTLSLAWYAICAYDLLLQACLAVRPYEKQPGQTDQVYQDWLGRLSAVIETRPSEGELIDQLAQASAEFTAVPVDRGRPRLRIGIVGEIYVRQHDFANNYIVRQLEQLGAETTLSGFPEWHFYTNWIRLDQAHRERNFRHWLVNFLQDYFQRKRHHRLSMPFKPILDAPEQTRIKTILGMAEPYLHPSLRGGEAVLSVGKMVELFHQGFHGAINVMPFSCMPSTIVDGVLKRLTTSLDQMPLLSISYDGQQDPMLRTRLEAFLYQVRAYHARKNGVM